MREPIAHGVLAAALAVGSAAAQEAGSREVQELMVSLKAPDPAVRASAARILGELGAAARPAVPDLVEVLADENREARQYAATTLGQIGSASPEVVPGLIGALKDKEWSVRRAAAVSLGRLGDRSAEEPLKAARNDSNKSVSEAAKRSLKALKKKN